MQTAQRAKRRRGMCVCVCVCVCACPCLSLPPRLRQIEGRSALRSKPPHHLPPTPQPSVCVCVLSFSLARCVCLTAGCTSWFVWHYHARNHAIMPIAGRVCELHHALCACVCVCRSCENVCVCTHVWINVCIDGSVWHAGDNGWHVCVHRCFPECICFCVACI